MLASPYKTRISQIKKVKEAKQVWSSRVKWEELFSQDVIIIIKLQQ